MESALISYDFMEPFVHFINGRSVVESSMFTVHNTFIITARFWGYLESQFAL